MSLLRTVSFVVANTLPLFGQHGLDGTVVTYYGLGGIHLRRMYTFRWGHQVLIQFGWVYDSGVNMKSFLNLYVCFVFLHLLHFSACVAVLERLFWVVYFLG